MNIGFISSFNKIKSKPHPPAPRKKTVLFFFTFLTMRNKKGIDTFWRNYIFIVCTFHFIPKNDNFPLNHSESTRSNMKQNWLKSQQSIYGFVLFSHIITLHYGKQILKHKQKIKMCKHFAAKHTDQSCLSAVTKKSPNKCLTQWTPMAIITYSFCRTVRERWLLNVAVAGLHSFQSQNISIFLHSLAFFLRFMQTIYCLSHQVQKYIFIHKSKHQ